MANLAIQIKVGNNPEEYVVGREYYFSPDNNPNSKISPSMIMDKLEKLLAEEFGEVYAIERAQ